MAKFIIATSCGTDDPTMATLPFMATKAAKEQGHDVVLWLQNKAVMLAGLGISTPNRLIRSLKPTHK